MRDKIVFLLSFLQCYALAIPYHNFHHHNRYHRRRIPPIHHGFMQHLPQPADFMPMPIIPFENKMPDFPLVNPLVDPTRSIRFRLYTRQNPNSPQELISSNPLRSRKTYFNPTKPTKILIHGALDSTRDSNAADWMNQMRTAYLDSQDVNVIVVDYSFFVLLLLYWGSLPNTYAYSISELVYNLSDEGKNLDNFHLVARSWGAHVAGLAGQNLCGKLGRITVLDPANPPFRFAGFQFRVDKRNAKFVDVYHFNGKPRFNIFTAVGIVNEYDGLSSPLGHVDIYPNLRERQATGCPVENAAIFTASCQLGMGARLFTETIMKNDTFLICPCESFYKYLRGECPCEASDLRYMGEGIPTATTGIFQMISKSQVKPVQPSTSEKPAEDLPASSSSTVAAEESISNEPTSAPGVTSSETTTSTTTAAPVTAATEIVLSTEAPSSSSVSSESPPSTAAPEPIPEVSASTDAGTTPESSSPTAIVSESSTSTTMAELTTEAPIPAGSSESSPAETTAAAATTTTSTLSPDQEAKANSILSEDGQSVSGNAIGRMDKTPMGNL